MRSFRVLRWIAWGIFVMAFVGMGIWYYLLKTWTADLHREIAALKAQGYPTSAAALIPAPIPADQNAAPIYEAALRSWGSASPPHFEYFPGETEAESGVLQSYVLLSYMITPTPAWRAEVARIMRKPEVASLLDVARRAAARPHCKFMNSGASGQPSLIGFWGLGSLVELQVSVLGVEGKTDDALGWAEVSLRVQGHRAEGYSAYVAEDHLPLLRILERDVTRSHRPSPSASKRFAARLGTLELRERFTASQIEDTDRLVEGIEGSTGDSRTRPFELRLAAQWAYFSKAGRPWRRRTEIDLLNLQRQFIDISRLPVPEGRTRWQRRGRDMRNLAAWTSLRRYHEEMQSNLDDRDTALAQIAVCQAAMLLQAYRAEHGKYPAALQDLPSTKDLPVPLDPITDRPLIYRRHGQGFIVYSVGINGKDDGGLDRTRVVFPDIVWRCDR